SRSDGVSRRSISRRSKRSWKRSRRTSVEWPLRLPLALRNFQRTNMKRLSSQWQQLPEKAVRQLQVEKLRGYLRRVVLPFSAHYRELFREQGLSADSFRSLEDLQRVPFTSKADLLNTPEDPQKFRRFILIPAEDILSRRPSI